MGLRGALYRENYVLSRVTKRLIENINKMSNKHILVGDMALKLCYNVSNISTKDIELESTNMKYYLDKDLGDETNPYCNTRASKIFGSAIFLSRDNSKEDIGKTLEALKGIKVNYMVAIF